MESLMLSVIHHVIKTRLEELHLNFSLILCIDGLLGFSFLILKNLQTSNKLDLGSCETILGFFFGVFRRMAGKLPGVECARRRRFSGSSGWCDSPFNVNSAFGSTRSWRLYESHFTSSSFSERSMVNQTDQDEKLDSVARKAKERLDGKLKSRWKSEINSQERSKGASLVDETGRKPSSSSTAGDMQAGVSGSKKSGSKMLCWGKMGLNHKSSDQEECVVCLEKFKAGEKLDRLPCAHRFHSTCLLPWLKGHAHCPCCRKSVLGSN